MFVECHARFLFTYATRSCLFCVVTLGRRSVLWPFIVSVFVYGVCFSQFPTRPVSYSCVCCFSLSVSVSLHVDSTSWSGGLCMAVWRPMYVCMMPLSFPMSLYVDSTPQSGCEPGGAGHRASPGRRALCPAGGRPAAAPAEERRHIRGRSVSRELSAGSAEVDGKTGHN